MKTLRYCTVNEFCLTILPSSRCARASKEVVLEITEEMQVPLAYLGQGLGGHRGKAARCAADYMAWRRTVFDNG
jgi:hypothetical protein